MKNKNIHILPTDKPSKLIKDVWNNTFSIVENFNRNHTDFKGNYIYITSDEEIKEGDWYLYGDEILKSDKLGTFDVTMVDICKKIILTTDQDLDGVQSIDDEFLEWFVNNPSCEEVKVYYDLFEFEKDSTTKKYIIIITKEETLEEAAEKHKEDITDAWSINEHCKSSFIDGAKSDAAKTYWYNIFKQNL